MHAFIHTYILYAYTSTCMHNRYLMYIYCTHLPYTQMILNQTKFHLVQNKSENGKYNLISVTLTKIRSKFLCVYIK